MRDVAITGTGVYVPEQKISNKELIASYNAYVDKFNADNKTAIDNGELEALPYSSEEFVLKASGIENRYIADKEGILDINRMQQRVPARSIDEPSYQCEAGVNAANIAMKQAGVVAEDIDAVIMSCSTQERDYPGLSVEIQNALGIKGFAFDMKMACSSATFGVQTAANIIKCGQARRVLVTTTELCGGNINFRDRDSHFIFGEATTAIVVEAVDEIKKPNSPHAFEVVSSKLMTQFSNNIRNNFGCFFGTVEGQKMEDVRYFSQNGRKVFKEVVPIASEWILQHIADHDLTSEGIRRLWLHQANINMNLLISKRILGVEPNQDNAPIVLNEYANTGACGSIIAFNHFHEDLQAGDLGILCSFGAGYSIGSLMLKKL